MRSGTTTFNMSASALIDSALRKTGRFGIADEIPASDRQNCLQSLNTMIKAMMVNQKPLWCIQRLAIPMVNGQSAYNLSVASGSTRPLRVLFAFIRDTGSNDNELTMVSRDDFSRLGNKTGKGQPNQAYYDPQFELGTLHLYNVPFDASDILYVDIQRQVQDVNLLTENLDFPQEAIHMLSWNLASEVAIEYNVSAESYSIIEAKAMASYRSFFDSDRETVSTFFSPAQS